MGNENEAEPIWLNEDLILALHDRIIEEFGGVSGVRDPNLVGSASTRPQNSHYYEGNGDIFSLAASYSEAIAKNHAFLDGNKRTAYAAADVFLGLNGLHLAPGPENENIYAKAIEEMAAGKSGKDALTQIYREKSVSALEADEKIVIKDPDAKVTVLKPPYNQDQLAALLRSTSTFTGMGRIGPVSEILEAQPEEKQTAPGANLGNAEIAAVPEIPIDWMNAAAPQTDANTAAAADFWAQYAVTPAQQPESPSPTAIRRPGSARTADGIFEEVSNWIKGDLTLKEASQSHVGLWFGEEATAHPHDMSHAIYGLAIKNSPDPDHFYQGDAKAEAFATAIQRALGSPGYGVADPASYATQEGFAALVKERAAPFEGSENLGRTLSWLIGGDTGQSVEEQRIKSGFEPNNIKAAAQDKGIKVTEDWASGDWKVETQGGKIYSYNAEHPEQTVLPMGSNGVENFEAFAIPPDQEIADVFNKIKPVLDDLQPQIRDATQKFGSVSDDTQAPALENLRVSDIAARMDGTSSAALDINARREAQPKTISQEIPLSPAEEPVSVWAEFEDKTPALPAENSALKDQFRAAAQELPINPSPLPQRQDVPTPARVGLQEAHHKKYTGPTDAKPVLTDTIRGIAASDPQIMSAMGGGENLSQIIGDVETRDQNFKAKGGKFFEAGATPQETAANYERSLFQFRPELGADNATGRASLPAVIADSASKLGIDLETPEYKTALMASALVEMPMSTNPLYHGSGGHYGDAVGFQTAFLLENDRLVAAGDPAGITLTYAQKATALLIPAIHDFGHEGSGNPPHDPFANEELSFRKAEPLLKAMGMDDASLGKIRLSVLTTSPNGPNKVLDGIVKAQLAGEAPNWDEIRTSIDPSNAKPDITNHIIDTLKPLETDPATARISTMMSGSDLAASGGMTLNTNRVMSELLTVEGVEAMRGKSEFLQTDPAAQNFLQEVDAAKSQGRVPDMTSPVATAFLERVKTEKPPGVIDFTTDGARSHFLNSIVGQEGFADPVVGKMLNPNFEAMREQTAANLSAPSPRPIEGPSSVATPEPSFEPQVSSVEVPHGLGRGVGIGMGVYGLYEQYKPGGTTEGDFKNKQTKGLAQAQTVANVGAVAADAGEVGIATAVARTGKGLEELSRAGKVLAGVSRASRFLPVVSTGLAVGAGAIDGAIGYKTGDGHRTARAVGSTAGGIGGAMAGGWVGAQGGAAVGGAIGAFFGGVGAVPGAAIGGFIGGLGGAIYGGMKGAEYGGKATEALAGARLQAKFDERLKPALDGLNQNKSWVNRLDRNHDGKIDTGELRKTLNADGFDNLAKLDANQDGRVTAKEISDKLNQGSAQERHEISVDRRGLDKMSADQLRNAIKADGLLPDTLKVNGKDVDIREALKDEKLLDRYASQFEKMTLRGDHDFSKEVSMLRELQERQAGQNITTQIVPAPKVTMAPA